VNDAPFVRLDIACGKDCDQQILSKTITSYRNIYNEIALSEDTNNPVYKLATDNLQLNVLIRSIF